MNYDAKWTGYGHTVTLKTTGHGKDYAVFVDEQETTVFDNENHAKAFFTGRIEDLRSAKISKGDRL